MNRKEIEDKLGFTRKEIRYLEDIGIMHNGDKIKGKEYEYSDLDIKRFYLVRFFKDCGYKAKDIKDVFSKYDDDEKKLIEESISKMENQIKKLNDNLKFAKAMKKNKFISFSDYSLLVNKSSQSYNEVSLGYIIMTEIYNSNRKNMEDILSFNLRDYFENMLDVTFEEVSKLDDMIIDCNYTDNEIYDQSVLIIEKIVDVLGFYSDDYTMDSIKVLSNIKGLSEKTITVLTNSYKKYYTKHKEETIEHAINCLGIDLINLLKNNSYSDDIVQEKMSDYFSLYKKMLNEEYILKYFKKLLSKPEFISILMNTYHWEENEAKKFCNEFLKAVEYYYEGRK